MSLRNISIALTSVLVLTSAPAFAQDAAIIQDNVQTNPVTGNRNTTKNTSNQSAGLGRYSRTDKAGVSRKNVSLNDIAGNRENTRNENRQDISMMGYS